MGSETIMSLKGFFKLDGPSACISYIDRSI